MCPMDSPSPKPPLSAVPPPQVVDHRVRTAARRRANMRNRLIESALIVFAEKGLDGTVIDDVIRAAGVSRGTFYKYFVSVREVMVALSAELCDELLGFVDESLTGIEAPDARLALGTRLIINAAGDFPLFARFTQAAGLEAAGPNTLIYTYLPSHLEDGMRQGAFARMPLAVALDFITGAVIIAITRAGGHDAAAAYPRDMVRNLLRGLGVPAARVETLCALEPPDMHLPPESLLARAEIRARDLGR